MIFTFLLLKLPSGTIYTKKDKHFCTYRKFQTEYREEQKKEWSSETAATLKRRVPHKRLTVGLRARNRSDRVLPVTVKPQYLRGGKLRQTFDDCGGTNVMTMLLLFTLKQKLRRRYTKWWCHRQSLTLTLANFVNFVDFHFGWLQFYSHQPLWPLWVVLYTLLPPFFVCANIVLSGKMQRKE